MDQQIFTEAVDFQSKPDEATLGASGGLLKAVIIHFDEAPTTSEELVISYTNETSDAYTAELYSEDPSENSTKDIVAEWDNGFVLDPGDAVKITYPNSDERTIGITVKYRHF